MPAGYGEGHWKIGPSRATVMAMAVPHLSITRRPWVPLAAAVLATAAAALPPFLPASMRRRSA